MRRLLRRWRQREGSLPDRDTDREHMRFEDLMRYRSALDWWYCRMFSAARSKEPFDEPRPQPSEFDRRRAAMATEEQR